MQDKACLSLAPKLLKMDPPMSLEGCAQRTAHEVMFSVLKHIQKVHGRLMRRCDELSFGMQPEGVPMDAEEDPEAVTARKYFWLYQELRAHNPELLQGNEGIYGARTDLEILAEICKSKEYEDYSDSDRATKRKRAESEDQQPDSGSILS